MDGVSALTTQQVTLHLGVLDQPYRAVGYAARMLKKNGKPNVPRAITTGDVAQILEDKYGIMQRFADVHWNDTFAPALENSVQGALEALMMGQVVDPWGSATQKIEARFRDFINSKEAERVAIPGTPTMAAIMGVNHRLKHPYSRKNPRRPSFRDTGLYVTSFRSWVDT